MNAANQQDHQLVAGIVRGDETALQILLRKYSQPLFEFSFPILNQQDLAQEAVSNVFISLWQRREVLCINHSVSTYLFTATSYQSLKILCKQVHSNEICIDDVRPEELVESHLVDREVQYNEFIDAVETLLEKMPAERQRVFRMNSFENLRYKDIAEALGISVNGVQKHMLRARRQIADALPGLGFQNPGGS